MVIQKIKISKRLVYEIFGTRNQLGTQFLQKKERREGVIDVLL